MFCGKIKLTKNSFWLHICETLLELKFGVVMKGVSHRDLKWWLRCSSGNGVDWLCTKITSKVTIHFYVAKS